MTSYILRRLVQSIIVLLIVMLITFTLPYFEPNGTLGPAFTVLGTHATKLNVHRWGVQNGIFHPYPVRFWNYIVQVFWHFNLGHSYKQNLSVWGIISLYVPRTIWLAVSSLVFTIIIAIPMGIYQASWRNSTFDYAATGTAFVLYGIPAFLLGILMLQFFSFGVAHLPASPPSGVAPWAMFTNPVGFILPVLTLTLLSIAFLSRFMRSAVLEVLVQDYIRTAKAKGCSARRVLFRHAFRNALGPIIIIFGLYIPALLGGAVVIESVFNYSGLGIQLVTAASSLDIPTVLGITLLVSILTLFGNFMADVMLGVANPRIRIQGRNQ
ncbi:MAG: ABC transporter permease [Acidimicrobiales bacterium]